MLLAVPGCHTPPNWQVTGCGWPGTTVFGVRGAEYITDADYLGKLVTLVPIFTGYRLNGLVGLMHGSIVVSLERTLKTIMGCERVVLPQ
jgi:hypothetical protein